MIVAIKQYPNKFNTCDNDITYQSTKMVSPSLNQHKSISDPYQILFCQNRQFDIQLYLCSGILGLLSSSQAPNHCWFHGFSTMTLQPKHWEGPITAKLTWLGNEATMVARKIMGEKGSPTLNPQQLLSVVLRTS